MIVATLIVVVVVEDATTVVVVVEEDATTVVSAAKLGDDVTVGKVVVEIVLELVVLLV